MELKGNNIKFNIQHMSEDPYKGTRIAETFINKSFFFREKAIFSPQFNHRSQNKLPCCFKILIVRRWHLTDMGKNHHFLDPDCDFCIK